MFAFHLAICVDNLAETEDFYTRVLGCTTGRRSSNWIDFNLFDHQLVCHLAPKNNEHVNPVDADKVPIPHFGVVLSMHKWRMMVKRLQSHQVRFVIEPKVRFVGKPGEQATCFFRDPSSNAIELKAFADMTKIFATD